MPTVHAAFVAAEPATQRPAELPAVVGAFFSAQRESFVATDVMAVKSTEAATNTAAYDTAVK